jgi:hypothetical protein
VNLSADAKRYVLDALAAVIARLYSKRRCVSRIRSKAFGLSEWLVTEAHESS